MGEEVETASPEIIIPGEWTQAAESIAHDHSLPSPLIALICGPKNSGKTTFSRILLNTLLYDKVAYLDTDVGQPEFTPPGCLALTIIEKQTPDQCDIRICTTFISCGGYLLCMPSPQMNCNFLILLVLSLRSNFFGDTSSKRDPRTYLNNVFSLYNYFREEAKPEVPLVINTPEWVKGNGYDALVEMLRCIACSPTHMVQVGISAESKNQELSVCLIEIASARRDDYNRSEIFYALNVSIVGLAVSSAKSSDSEYGTPWCVVLGVRMLIALHVHKCTASITGPAAGL
ncbi:hypothetical protein MKW92_036960 [Papaver armeniacum]|nr:hypothetical protein MKW92_036960 [Papaver armeniacum]